MIVTERLWNLHTTEAARGRQQALTPEGEKRMDGIGVGLVGELDRVLENLDEAAHGIDLVNGANIHDVTVTSDGVPLAGKGLLVGHGLSQGDHVQMRMPEARPGTTLDLVRPHGPGDAVEAGALPPVLAHPKLTLGGVEVAEALQKVGAVFDGQSDQKRP